jgi:hypothetical protein
VDEREPRHRFHAIRGVTRKNKQSHERHRRALERTDHAHDLSASPPFAYSHEEERIVAFDRITVRAEQMGGVPCIRGLRIPVATVIAMVADG